MGPSINKIFNTIKKLFFKLFNHKHDFKGKVSYDAEGKYKA